MSLFHASRKSYSLLERILRLPSSKTLSQTMVNLDIHPGISQHVLQVMKMECESMALGERICSIMFDEMAIRENLNYNSEHDYVEGYEDVGDKRTEKVTIIYKIIIKSIVPIFRLIIIVLLFLCAGLAAKMEAASILLSCKEFH